jgi:hypothetical protein
MTKDKVMDLRTKILQGIELAYKRLLISKQKEDEDLVISKNGQVVRVKAKDLNK